VLARVVRAAIQQRLLVLAAVVVLIAAGVVAYRHLNVEAYPNPVPPMIEVVVQPSGLGPEEVEKFVTIPVEIGLGGMPGLDHVRSQSLFGLSDVKCYFKWGTDYAAARQEVINRLQFVELPHGVEAQLSPWSATGEVYRYTLAGKGYSLSELKTAQDFVLERQLKQVPGVIDVTSFGGETKQYHVSVDPIRLRDHGVTLSDLLVASSNANQSVGGQRLTLGAQSYDVRGVGLIRDLRDIENVVVDVRGGTPIRVHDVATVEIGPAPRLGVVGRDDEADVVQGIVLMRFGAETPDTLAGIRERLERIKRNRLLPPGMEIRPYYDRGALIATTTGTVRHNMIVGIVLVSAVLFAFLGSLRAAFITAVTIPLALLAAFCGLVATGTSANLISLGAIDFGIVVESSVLMTESIFRKLGPDGRGSVGERVVAAASEVAGPLGFSAVIIGVSFLPLFTLTGVSGVVFAPMARTYALTIAAAIVLALTVGPVLAMSLLRERSTQHTSVVARIMHRIYGPLFRLGIERPWVALGVAMIPVLLAGVLTTRLGQEFMPKLEEGNLWIRATLPISISREQSGEYADRMRSIVRGCPPTGPCAEDERAHREIELAVSQVGRPDDGTDVTGFNNIEIFAPLRPSSTWARGQTKERLVAGLSDELESAFPGVVFNFSQMIGDNVEEAVAGVKGENSIKVFGPDIASNERVASDVMSSLAQVHGIEDLGFFQSLGQPNVRIVPDREAAARYGLNVGDVLASTQAAIGGQAVTRVFEGDKSFDLTVRWAAEARQSVDAVRALLIATPGGAQVPLAQIAAVEVVEGPATVYREDGQRYTPLKFSVRGRDLAGAVEDAQAHVNRAVSLPYDSHLEWSGELNELTTARHRLAIILPLTLLLVSGLAFAAARTWKDTLIVLSNLPVVCAGGVLALLATGTNLSVSAVMGFVSVLGLAVQDGILVVTYRRRLLEEGLDATDAARQAVDRGLTPALMTASVAMFGLLPAALSHQIGSQTQRPLAIVVIGGALCLTVVSRLLQPALLTLSATKR
jgi:cobalt-zinc-cadmium resistance protein CzcA